MSEWKKKLQALSVWKYPILVLLVGALLMLLPGSQKSAGEEEGTDPALQQVLHCTQGVGEVRVIVSEQGAVVVCEGADQAAVRLAILRAVNAYTGFGSDRITVLKMAQADEGGDAR